MEKILKIRIPLLILVGLLQVFGTISVVMWETTRNQKLAEMGASTSMDRAILWLVLSTLAIILGLILIWSQRRISLTAIVFLAFSLICHLSIYTLSFQATKEILDIFPGHTRVEDLTSNGVLSQYSISWSLSSSWQEWWWLWLCTVILTLIICFGRIAQIRKAI